MTGKSYTSNVINKNFYVRPIEFDYIILCLTESIRNFYEKKEINDEYIPYHKNIFDSKTEFNKFLMEIKSIVEDNQKLCEIVYSNFIKDVRPSSTFRPGIDERKDVINLGAIGEKLEPIGYEIMNLILKFIRKDSQTILFEGVYFGQDSNYRKKIEDSFEKIINIETLFDRKKNIYFYKYNGEQLKSINQIIENLKKSQIVNQKLIAKSDVQVNKKMKGIHIIKKILKPIIKSKKDFRRYQIFDPMSEGDSMSYEKIKILGIPKNLSNKYVLDLGCNEGYYCFECEKRGANVVGIELYKKWFDLAQKRKKQFSSNVIFKNIGWDSIDSLKYKFDLVLFLAAFHYLKNNQLEMLKKIFKKMNPGAMIIIEMGLSDKNEGDFWIDEIKRHSGEICQYPNMFSIKKLLADAGFIDPVIYGKSMDIKGDPVPRYVIHARK